jgi:hypothetical protein
LRGVNPLEANHTKTLREAFDKIHTAIFGAIDVNKDGNIDEYEASPTLTMREFFRANRNRRGEHEYFLDKGEFMNYATSNLFWFDDNAENLKARWRSQLNGVFKRLDNSPRNNMLTPNEVSDAALRKIRLSFEYPRLHLKFMIEKADGDAFAKADKNPDGQLGWAEFEDLYVDIVLTALEGTNIAPPAPVDPNNPPQGPGGGGEPAPAPAPVEPAPPAGGGHGEDPHAGGAHGGAHGEDPHSGTHAVFQNANTNYPANRNAVRQNIRNTPIRRNNLPTHLM